LFLTLVTYSLTGSPESRISWSMVSTASFAPPCSGPESAPMPADTEA